MTLSGTAERFAPWFAPEFAPGFTPLFALRFAPWFAPASTHRRGSAGQRSYEWHLTATTCGW